MGLGLKSEMKVVFPLPWLLPVPWPPNTPAGARGSGKGESFHCHPRPWGEGGCRPSRQTRASSLSSCALQREGLHLQRVHRLLPGFLPVPCLLCGQRDLLRGWLLLSQRFEGIGWVGGWSQWGLQVFLAWHVGIRGLEDACLWAARRNKQ